MSSRKSIGRAFPIRKADVGAYRTARPNGSGYRPNPMGVTTLSAVNGRGAYLRAHSARTATQGLSRTERVARARRLMNNGSPSMQSNRVHRAAFVQRMSKNSGTKMASSAARRRSGKRLAAYGAAIRSGKSKTAAKRASLRAVPQTKTEKRKLRPNLSRSMSRAQSKAYSAGFGATFGKKKRKKRKTTKTKAAKRRAAPKRRTRRGTPEQMAARKAKRAAMSAKKKARRSAVSARKKDMRAKKMARTAARRAKMNTPEARRRRAKAKRRSSWPKQIRRTAMKKRTRVAYGPYKRVRAYNARTGRSQYSYMTRAKGKVRRIPAWAVAGAMSAKDYKSSAEYTAARERIAKRRRAAAARIERGGDAFTPNAGAKKVAKSKKKRAKKKSRGRRKTKRTSAKRGKRRVKRVRFLGRRRRKPSKKRRTAKRRSPKRRSAKRGKRRSTKRKTAKRSKRRSPKRRSAKRGKRRSTKRVGRRKVRRLRKGLYMVSNRRGRRHGRRHLKANRRRHMRRNGRRYIRNGFKADLMTLLKTGGLILFGFFAHKALTGIVVKALTSADGAKFAGMDTVGTDGKQSMLAQWQKPVTGLVVGGVVVTGLSMVKAVKVETRMSISAGVMVSFLESLIKTALAVAGQPAALSYLEGYSNSAAYSLRGARGRRGMRGLGMARNAGSIMPQYAPVGQFRQAAAGMGEYFKPSAGMGEYFAGPGVQGVGHYEAAGPLALAPSRSHMGNLPVDDGIRPDANLDHVLDLAESAAGLGGGGYTQAAAGMGQFRQAAAGMGEYFTASPSGGGFAESVVPTQSQWIPSGPLWAGSTPAEAAYTESELPAGVLQGSGGNGVLSG